MRRKKISHSCSTGSRKPKINRAGCFKYEAVEGAKANALGGAVPEEVKEERWHRFMAAQKEVSSELLEGKVGSMIDVIIDEVDEDGAIGRSKWDAPEIDGNVFLNGERRREARRHRAR